MYMTYRLFIIIVIIINDWDVNNSQINISKARRMVEILTKT